MANLWILGLKLTYLLILLWIFFLTRMVVSPLHVIFFLTFLFLFSVRVHATLIGFSFEAGAAAELWLYNVIYVCTVSMFHFWRLLWSFALRLLYKKNLTHSLPPHDNQHTKTLTHLGLCLEQILLVPPLCCCSGACMVTKLKVSDQKWRSAKSYIFILIAISLNAWAKLKGKLLAIWIVSQNFWNAFQFQSVLFQIFLSTKKLLLLWVCELFLDILLSAIRKLYLMYMCVIWDLDPISWKKISCLHLLLPLTLFPSSFWERCCCVASKFFDIFSLGEKTLISGIY